MSKNTILVADGEEVLRTNLTKALTDAGFEVIPCADGQAALDVLKSCSIDAIIADPRLPGPCGVDLMDHARKLAPNASIIVVTAARDVAAAAEAKKNGAAEFFRKPVILDELIFRLKRLLAYGELAKQNEILRGQIKRSYACEDIVARSSAMISIVDAVGRIAHSTGNVLICGESGTGKEALARRLHFSGVTRDRPFVALNCGALVEATAEAELFGYRRGAFAGADANRIGYFEAAEGGTLFLDEIVDLPLASQAVLLRVIEDRAFTRIGDTRARSVNVRVVAATNRDLEKAIEAGEFREDLFHCLNAVRFTVPPLRERPEDIRALIEHFVRKYNAELKRECPGFEEEAVQALCQKAWRGNARELENVVEHALIVAGSQRVTPRDLLPDFDTDGGTLVSVGALNLRTATREFERQHISKVMEQFDDNKIATAHAMGIGVSSLYRKLEALNIHRSSKETAASA